MITRQECAAMVVGGPTTVLDLGGLRVVSDPTFDAPGPHGYLTKTAGPAVAEDQLRPVDLVLVSHDNHADNLDDRGRALTLAAPLVLTTRSGAGRLGQPAVGLAPWTSHSVPRPDGGELTVTAVPAVHGPEDGERDVDGFVNCEVVGFILSGHDLPTIYVSGDNASIRTVAEITRRGPAIDATVLHAGAARVASKFHNRALSLDSIRAAAAAAVLGPAAVIPAHYDGWAHFSEGRDDLARAFGDAGLSAQLRLSDHGTWILGHILSIIGKKPLATLLQEKVLGPMGLTNTTSSETSTIPEPVLHSYSSERKEALHIPSKVNFYEEATYWNTDWGVPVGANQTTNISDMTKTAVAVGTGQLLFRSSYHAMTDPNLLGFGHAQSNCAPSCFKQIPAYNFGLGVVRSGSWILQNPLVSGYSATEAYLPSQKIAIAVVTTFDAAAFNSQGVEPNASDTIFRLIGAYVAPSDAPPMAK